MKRLAFLLMAGLVAPNVFGAAVPVHTMEVLSQVYSITKKYKSMEGPSSLQPLVLIKGEPPQLAWITSVRTEIVGSDGQRPESPEFMCHVNLDMNVQKHAKYFEWKKMTTTRLLTLSQGQFGAVFPEGFGLPVLTSEEFSLATQVLNHNFDNPNYQVRHKVTVTYVLDKDLKKPMQPLYATSGFVMHLLEGQDGYYGKTPAQSSMEHGPSCLPGTSAPAAGGASYTDGFGRKFSGHWVVVPGRVTSRTNVTKLMHLPFDTTMHYVNVHLHPFAESIELIDLTTGKRLFKSKAKNPKGRIGLDEVGSYSSKKGIPVYQHHEYEMAVTYNNPTGVNQDAMATMLIYVLDREFKQPDLARVASDDIPLVNVAMPAAITGREPRLRLRTTKGDMEAILFEDVAPKTIKQLMRLVKAGVYDNLPFVRLEPGFVLQTATAQGRQGGLTPEQRALISRLPPEFSATPHARGILSMARKTEDLYGGETSFSILLGNAPHLDASYTVFGKVVKGLDVLTAIEKMPVNPQKLPLSPVVIKKAEILPAAGKR